MTDRCEEALARLYLYLDGELDDPVEMDGIRRHLTECPPCDGAYSFEERLRVVVRERMRQDVPPVVIERIRAVIREARQA